MLEEWLIDGYNLLHDVSSRDNSAEVSREMLFGLLAGFASTAERKVLMVLDGRGDECEFEAYKTKKFSILYSQAATADSVIEQTLCERKGSSLIMVVTKDRALTQMARGLGSRVMKPAEFMDLVKASTKENNRILFDEKVRSHGFNRPFENKLKFPIE